MNFNLIISKNFKYLIAILQNLFINIHFHLGLILLSSLINHLNPSSIPDPFNAQEALIRRITILNNEINVICQERFLILLKFKKSTHS